MTTIIDVLVIGAGPSGSSFAYNLKKQNQAAQVLLLDKAHFPRYKPCGGGISKDVHRYLDFSLEPVISTEVHSIELALNQKTFACELPEGVYMVRREAFDHYLLEKAKAIGVIFKPSSKVIDAHFSKESSTWTVFIEGREPIQTKILILAEGGAGGLAKKLGIDLKLNVAAAIEYEHPAPPGSDALLIDFNYIDYGYSWNFPKHDGQSIGVGGELKGREKAGGLKGILKDYLTRFSIPELNKDHLFGHPAKLYSGKRKLAYAQLLLIGECAGCVDPLTIEGIRPAIKSGFIAAEVVDRALKANNYKILQEYNQAFHQNIGSDFQYARLFNYLFYKYKKKLLVKNKGAIDAFWQVFSGKKRYRDFLNFRRILRYVYQTLV